MSSILSLRNPTRSAILTGFFAIGAGAAADAQDPRAVFLVPSVAKRITVDGDLEEWTGKPSLAQLATETQFWNLANRRARRGAADFSADLWYAHDQTHLFLAGKIVDDDHVPVLDGADLETGDSIEVFLDVSSGEGEDVVAGDRLGREDVQLFLQPLAGKWFRRPWDRDNPRAKPPPTGSELSGTRLAAKRLDGTSYTFEARIPLYHFLPLQGGPIDRVGFHLAINDRDRGSDVCHYVTLDGNNPTLSTSSYRSLRFDPPLFSAQDSGLRIDEQLTEFLPWALVGLLVLTAILFFSRRVPLVHLPPLRARLVRVLGVVLLLVGICLPVWMSSSRSDEEEQIDVAVKVLEEQLPRMTEGTLTSYVGDSRDRPLLDLLQGASIKRKQSLSYRFLSEIATERGPKSFGDPPREYPEERFKVRPYWLPLPAGQPQSFAWKQPLERGRVFLVLSPDDGWSIEQPPLAVRVTYRLHDGAEIPRILDLPAARVACTVFGKSNREMTYVSDDLPEGAVVGVSVTSPGEGIQLVGMTLVPMDPEAQPRPLLLGQALGGVETELRGVHPKDAGFELLPNGEVRRVEIPRGRVRGYDKLWLVYSATYPVLTSSEPSKGEEVCRVKIHFTKGKPEIVRLRHQESMFYEVNSRNSEDIPEGVPAVQAEVGGGAAAAVGEGEDKRINVVYRVDLRGKPLVNGVEFESIGTYPIRFRSVVFGYERSVTPPESSDSPLEPGAPGEVHLKKDVLLAIQGAKFGIYRNGSLAVSDLTDRDSERHAEIPARAQAALLTEPGATVRGSDVDNNARIFRRFLPLPDESGTVLGVFGADEGFGERQRLFSVIGMAFCLLSVPFLLLLFNDALAWLSNLRLRLMAVVSVAAVVPMAVLFILLVQTLEGDHEATQQRAVRQAVRTAADQLRDRQDKLLESARNQVDYLRKLEEQFRSLDPLKLKVRLQSAMSSQRDFKGGFMKLEYKPPANAPKPLEEFTTFDDESDTRLDTPLREVPGFYVGWGEPFIGVRCDAGTMSLSVARPLDAELLDEVGAKEPAILCSMLGDPLSASKGHLMLSGENASLIRERAAVRDAARESRQPVFLSHRLPGGSWIAAYDVLRDAQDTPRAILGILRPDEKAKLTLATGPVPVRTFFVVMAGLLLVVSLALASIVTSRITDPIERLEQGAESLGRGELDVRIDCQEGGQIGRLTESFNNMAQDLRGRIQDLNHLNRGMQELTSGLDLDQVLNSAVAFFSRHSSADRVRVILLDWERDRAELFGEDRTEVDRRAPDVANLLAATGPLCMKLSTPVPSGVLAGLFPGYQSVLAFPLVIAGRSRGCILLLFESAEPTRVNLELLSTIAAQTTAAVENARLYHHAVEDLYTGAYVPDYFSRLVGRAVAVSQEEDASLSLVGVQLRNGDRAQEALGVEGYGRYMERVASVLRRQTPAKAQICRSADDGFQVLVPEADGKAVRRTLEVLEQSLVDADLGLRGPADLNLASVTFPAEGASAEFLFHALESKMKSATTAPAMASIQHEAADAGVVLSSPAMTDVVRVLQKVAPSDLTILLEGETGTGKEILANLIHKWSQRAKGPLVKVHCAALSESLLQSELFGHEKGAFTGATGRRIGKFEQAEGGSIFLDEIGEVSLDTQVKLLRVLQEREVDRVGGSQPVPVDVRVIAATNRDIEAMVAAGSFREDLYYRLQGMVITVPPLRERKSEIPSLLEVFRREAVAAGHTAVRGFSTDAMDEVFRRDWPGNIRELRNAAFRAMVLAEEGLMERSHLLGILPPSRPEEGAAEAGPRSDSDPFRPAPLPEVVLPRSKEAADDEGPAGHGSEATPELGPRLENLLSLIRERGSVSNGEYVEASGLSSRTGLRDLGALLRLGLIERLGRRRGARYRARPVANSPSGPGENENNSPTA